MADKYSSEAEELVLGSNVTIGDNTRISGGRIVLGDDCRIGHDVEINVLKELVLGKGSRIGDFSIIRGRELHIGRDAYTNHHAEIGGGSCFEISSSLTVGYWFHLGSHAMVNTAMPVEIGDEVGLGRMTNIYTHGAYLSEIDGFPTRFAPVKIGNRVWIPSATVNPGINIGDDVVIGVGSVITHDIPSGSLAMGVPCRVVKKNAFPAPFRIDKAMTVVGNILENGGIRHKIRSELGELIVGTAIFSLHRRTIQGGSNNLSERARELLRRHGIRFKAEIVDGEYRQW